MTSPPTTSIPTTRSRSSSRVAAPATRRAPTGAAQGSVACGCPACKAGLQPFTVPHFRKWARALELDNGRPWVVEPFFEAFLADYFAGIPELWLIVPEGNTKTTSMAGLTLYLLEHRRSPWIPWAASSRDQAEIGYRQAEGFVTRSPRLKSFLKCQDGYRRIKNIATGGRLQIFAADDATGDGVIPTDALIDELHRHKDLRLYRTWHGKLEKRGGQLSTFSTAGEPGSEFEIQRELIRQTVPVVERRPGYIHCRSAGFAFHEYAVPEGGDVTNMNTVKLANPFSAITPASLARKFASPTMTIAYWRRFVGNLATRSRYAAIQEAEWYAATAEDLIPVGTPIWLGLDVAWKWDTTAAVPLWWFDKEHRQLGLAKILTPPRDGSSLDPNEVEQALVAIHHRNPIHTVVMDMTKAEQLAAWIESELGATVIDRQQTHTQAAEDYERFMEALRSGWLMHSGDAELTRHVLNAVSRILPRGDARFERPSQTRQGGDQDRRVIDGLTAAAMVNSVAATVTPELETPYFVRT